MNLLWAIGASILVSLIAFIGIFSLLIKERLLQKILLTLVGFSAGGLMGGSFFHLLPEALEETREVNFVFLNLILGFIIFFILERYFRWRHCHKGGKCEIHPFTYLNLLGDGLHNLVDGLVLGGSFFTDLRLGLITTLAIILHEIPQELGDFGILLYGGFSKTKALIFNFFSALSAVLGTGLGFFFSSRISSFSQLLLPVASGGFIYIASCDLIPELHRQPNTRETTLSILFFILGIIVMWGLKFFLPY
ncbi:MAG: ZIP family metal transporter [Candidatus Omnitrophica bacterium]|nr:ZIP family metal transporter [Candidatus Omnitrophota bacterium]MCM8798436.1 ZIP family metal transporter [Candidatus Omnitrophota bacterium]